MLFAKPLPDAMCLITGSGQILAANDANEAMEMFQENKKLIELVFTDINWPERGPTMKEDKK